ncbi:ferrous iron transport protein A [Streptomyces sp. NPDC054833]
MTPTNRDSGRPDVSWPASAMTPGTRVTVVQDPSWAGPWQAEFQGVINDFQPPAPVRHATAQEGELAYWVVFDSPQYDSDGCGPYYKAQIWDRYLRPVSQ